MEAYFSWPMEILVTNESMKRTEGKQLADYVFVRCIALARSFTLLLLAGIAV